MSTGPHSGPNRAGAGLVERLRQGEGYERLYNAYASQLYRYCWTLVGDDADEAVYEALLSAVELIDELDDHSDLRAWLFALARGACQRRGFAEESPYARIATDPTERPMAEIALRLPPSHSELLELYLRHGLAPSQIARIHGLDADITSELCRAAVRRAAEVCAECAPKGDGEIEYRIRPDHANVSEVLALVEPPAPPEGLRDRTVEGCADSAARAEASAPMVPLGPEGFPLQRDRSELTAQADDDAPATVGLIAADTDGPDQSTSDEATTEVAAAGLASGGEPAHTGHRPRGGRRRRQQRGRRYGWPLSATSGLLTVGVALALWGAALMAAGDTSESSHSDQPGSTGPQPAAEGTSERDSPTGTAPGGGADPNQSGGGGDAGNAPDDGATSGGSDARSDAATDDDATEARPSQSAGAGQQEPDGDSSASPEDEAGDGASEDDSAGSSESPDAGEEEDEPERGPISRFFEGLFNPGGDEEDEEEEQDAEE